MCMSAAEHVVITGDDPLVSVSVGADSRTTTVTCCFCDSEEPSSKSKMIESGCRRCLNLLHHLLRCSHHPSRDGEKLTLPDAYMAERSDLLGEVVDVGS